MPHVRIATRSSAQARTQAQAVADALNLATPDLTTELVFVDTLGDRDTTSSLHAIGGQGVFVKEVQRAVLDGVADIAVHSAKDLPSAQHDGLAIAAFTARRTPNDALVGATLDALDTGATVATGSVRRRAQLHRLRPDLKFVELRGNIGTRLDKVPDGGAIVIAVAALEILGLTERISQVMTLDEAVPMVGQGCVAVEVRVGDEFSRSIVATVDDPSARRAVETERSFLATLGAGCTAPVAAHVSVDDMLRAFMANDANTVQIECSLDGTDDHRSVGAEIARECMRQLGDTRRNTRLGSSQPENS